jgi:hypothetical protein
MDYFVLLRSYVNQKVLLIVHVELRPYQVIWNRNVYQHERQIRRVMPSRKKYKHSLKEYFFFLLLKEENHFLELIH